MKSLLAKSASALLMLTMLGLAQAEPEPDHWAVLVTGSKGYTNYRHHADVCHAYHIMIKQGIPEDKIILMSYNDAVNAKENPIRGKLFNKPDGEDVYAGCKIDYEGDACNSHNFLNVLKGNATGVVGGNGKVLKSDENSKVFLYFVDHGAPGFIYFPDIENDKLYADVFNQTLLYMYENKKYNELVIYMEACYSGSMFQGILPEQYKIYVMTAANPTEPSRATYCHP
jgi:legumain